MNSSRRGAVHGFRLESLNKITETKSHDRKQTLLNYIVHMVEKVFPNVLTFYEDLDIHAACSGKFLLLVRVIRNRDIKTCAQNLRTFTPVLVHYAPFG